MTDAEVTNRAALIEAIDAELPQTQCGKCGQPGCRPYAEAIASGEAINRCPPGGQRTVERLAEVTERPSQPLAEPTQEPRVALIREDECIGCTKCIQACPVDAIIGASRQMHTVIAAECTGCELCVAPCPVDCIDLLPHPDWLAAQSDAEERSFLARRADLGRRRFEARKRRLARQAREKRLERQRRLIRQASRANRSASGARGEERQRRLAVKAAEQAVKRVRQQLESARRRADAGAEATALAQLPEAERLLAEARKSLAQATAAE